MFVIYRGGELDGNIVVRGFQEGKIYKWNNYPSKQMNNKLPFTDYPLSPLLILFIWIFSFEHTTEWKTITIINSQDSLPYIVRSEQG